MTVRVRAECYRLVRAAPRSPAKAPREGCPQYRPLFYKLGFVHAVKWPSVRHRVSGFAGAVLVALFSSSGLSEQVTDVGSRRELFVDAYLVDRLSGGATLRLHHPQPREVVMVFDRKWEGNATAYSTVFEDGGRYRMYYRAWDLSVSDKGVGPLGPQKACYAESEDGIRWTRKNLGRYEFDGSRENNIVLMNGDVGGLVVGTEAPAVFKDDRPGVPDAERYKVFFHYGKYGGGLVPYGSPDGFVWHPMSRVPVIVDHTTNAFDSQICSFWDAERGLYRVYWRYMSEKDGGRSIRTAVSKDFLHWADRKDLTFTDSPPEQLYENCIKPYHRAPHLLIGFPVRYLERGWSHSMRQLPDSENRANRAKSSERYGTALTEALLMASRDGVNFKRWNEAFLRPGIERSGTWNYGQLYVGWHLVETKSPLEGAPNELSLYASEGYWLGRGSSLRRYTLRLDGFVSVSAPMAGGEVISKPFRFKGSELRLNFSTSAAGSVRVEIQDEEGAPLSGFVLQECEPIFGDAIERAVVWDGRKDVGSLQGKVVRLRFVLNDADVYAFQFTE